MTHKPLVLSGMQPTNTLHLGNYLGALKNWVRMQNEMPCLFCVVDMHAITTDAAYGKPEELTRATREVAAAYIAAGVDPVRTPVFNQGQVPEHAELSWIFNCVARLGWLDQQRIDDAQFKLFANGKAIAQMDSIDDLPEIEIRIDRASRDLARLGARLVGVKRADILALPQAHVTALLKRIDELEVEARAEVERLRSVLLGHMPRVYARNCRKGVGG